MTPETDNYKILNTGSRCDLIKGYRLYTAYEDLDHTGNPEIKCVKGVRYVLEWLTFKRSILLTALFVTSFLIYKNATGVQITWINWIYIIGGYVQGGYFLGRGILNEIKTMRYKHSYLCLMEEEKE
jgi:hypothetical protein